MMKKSKMSPFKRYKIPHSDSRNDKDKNSTILFFVDSSNMEILYRRNGILNMLLWILWVDAAQNNLIIFSVWYGIFGLMMFKTIQLFFQCGMEFLD